MNRHYSVLILAFCQTAYIFALLEIQMHKPSDIWDSHNSEEVKHGLLLYVAVICKWLPTFQMNV